MIENPPSAAIMSEGPAPTLPDNSILVDLNHAPARRLAPLRWLAGTMGSVVRRPLRAFGIILLLCLFGWGTYIGGMYAWGSYHFRAARNDLERYHTADAREHLQRCLSVWPNDPDTLVMMARALRRLDLLDQAEDCLERIRRMRAHYTDPLLERLLLRLARGEAPHLEENCLARVEQGDPDSGLILEALIQGAVHTYQIPKARYFIQRWLEREPDNTQALLLHGLIFDYMSLHEQAASAFRRVLELDPEHDDARLRLAQQMVDLHRYAEAIPHLEYLQTRRPDGWGIAIILAQCKDQLLDHAGAEAILDDVLAHDPDFAPALAERGKVALRDGQSEQAEEWLRRASKVDPGDYTIHYMLYQCLVKNGKAREADDIQNQLKQIEEDTTNLRDIITSKMQAAPRDVGLHYKAGMVAFRSGAYKEALRWFKSALKIDPSHAPSHRALADFYRRIGQIGEAQRHWEAALAADPEGTKSANPPNDAPKR